MIIRIKLLNIKLASFVLCLILTWPLDVVTAGAKPGDLAGTWESNSLASGPGAPWWFRASWTVDAGGNMSGSGTESDGGTGNFSGIFTSSSDGWLRLNGIEGISNNPLCSIDSKATVLVCSETWNDGTTNLIVGMKKSASYSMADLEGAWYTNGLASGPGAPWWEQGSGNIDMDGKFSGSSIDSNHETSNHTGVWSLSPDGFLTCISDCNGSTAIGVMDAGKTMIVITDTWSQGTWQGTAEMKLFTKKAASYSMADLVGTWHSVALASGPGSPWWERIVVTIKKDGFLTGTAIESDGAISTWSGRFEISEDGIITCQEGCHNPNNGRGVMDASKTVMVFTATWSGSYEPGTTELRIMTKDSPATAEKLVPAATMLLLE